LVHLDLIESLEDDYGRTTTHELKWRYSVVDGERGPRGLHASPAPDARSGRRRDDGDERRGRREDKSRNWSSRLS
jgi:hypothetical protein